MQKNFTNVQQAIADLRQGKMIILVDDESRENEGDLIIAAEKITAEAINFMTQFGRGLVCMPMAGELIDRLRIPQMVQKNTSRYQTAFTVSIGAASGVTTGISAADRARTVQVAIADDSTLDDITMPGHIFPLRARDGGVLARAGHTEGSIDLMKLAGLKPAAVLCEIMNKDGTMARFSELKNFAKQHQLCIVSINDLVSWRFTHETLITEIANANLPLKSYGDFVIRVFESQIDGAHHLALIKGDLTTEPPVLVRLHSECLTGDIFGSTRCDCGLQLQTSLARIEQEGGVLLYMRQEGRGIGLANKIKAYAVQEQQGLDTVEANHHLGFAADQRDYGIGAQILRLLGIKSIRLLTNNPSKIIGIQKCGIEVSVREAVETAPTKANISYLETKRKKLGHLLEMAVWEK